MFIKKISLILILIFSPLVLSGCTGVGALTGVAAAGGIAVAQEGGLSRAWSDAKIQVTINELWFQESVDIFRKLDLTINQGRVLITGVVQDPEHRVEAVRLAWKPAGVKQVINEIRVAESEGVIGFARDGWAATRLRTTITLDRDVQSINYNIDVVQGIVYLMGVAQNRAELNRVIETARTVPDVKQVVSYVKLAGEVDQEFVPERPVESESSFEDMSQDSAQSQVQENVQKDSPFQSVDDGVDDGYSANSFKQEPDGGPVQLQRTQIESIQVEQVQ